MNWIKVEDRLPDNTDYVLVYSPEHHLDIVIADWWDKCPEWWDQGNVTIKGVTHWMPLPPKPEE